MCFLIVVLFLWSACFPAFLATPEGRETGATGATMKPDCRKVDG
ncbi:hypothetical protein BN128_996 [Cronobacter sakazakii 696]|nr:hypothetical protein BN128_996 [Cronobacter sakazakii 696]